MVLVDSRTNRSDTEEGDDEGSVDPERKKKQCLRTIAKLGRTDFPSIMLYSSIIETGSASEGIKAFSSIHANLMALHGFMAGFQYVVLERTAEIVSTPAELSNLRQAEFVLRVIGFGFSLTGTIISLITMEYLKSIESEDLKMQVEGCMNYACFFRHSDELAILASLMLALTTNLLLYDYLPIWICITLNVLTGVTAVYIVCNLYSIIIARQKYGDGGRHLYKDDDFN